MVSVNLPIIGDKTNGKQWWTLGGKGIRPSSNAGKNKDLLFENNRSKNAFR